LGGGKSFKLSVQGMRIEHNIGHAMASALLTNLKAPTLRLHSSRPTTILMNQRNQR
jgi:tRNA A37 threonylcarbamoyltransferase TsaD